MPSTALTGGLRANLEDRPRTGGRRTPLNEPLVPLPPGPGSLACPYTSMTIRELIPVTAAEARRLFNLHTRTPPERLL